MSKFDLQKVKQAILCCITEGYACNECPYRIFNNKNTNCQDELIKDINETFLRFDILMDSKD